MKSRCIPNWQTHFLLSLLLPIFTLLLLSIPVAEAMKMYWTSEKGIHRADLDGGNLETILPIGLLSPFSIVVDEDIVTGLGYPQGIAVDADGGKIYWTHMTPYKIQRANLDGTNVENLIMGLPGPEGIAIDADRGKIYWTQAWLDMEESHLKGIIRRANLDGTNVEDLFTEFVDPRFIALDLTPPSKHPVSVGLLGKQPVLWGRLRQSALLQNFPNLFNLETWIPFYLAQDIDVTIRVYNLHGRIVRTLSLGRLKAGYYDDRTKAAYWDGRSDTGESVSSGIYFYHFIAGDFQATKKMIIVR
jgi:hypothetical protein